MSQMSFLEKTRHLSHRQKPENDPSSQAETFLGFLELVMDTIWDDLSFHYWLAKHYASIQLVVRGEPTF